MTVKIGINGFGRIGRNFFRAAKQRAGLDFVAVNDITDAATLAHLLKYDSVLGRYPGESSAGANGIVVDGDELRVLAERDPANLPWKELGAEIVIESTGLFTERDDANKHLEAGAEKVIISAPAKGEDLTVVLGVNDDTVRPGQPPRDLERVVHHELRRADGEGPGRRLRGRAGLHDHDPRVHERPADPRPAAQGPAAGPGRRRQHHPDDDGRGEGDGARARRTCRASSTGIAMRVPVPDGSVTDLVAQSRDEADDREVNAAFRAAAESGPLAGKLVYTEDPIVSSDIVGTPPSCTFDAASTMVMGNTVKIVGWYDNEWGYSNRLVDLVALVAAKR